MSWIALDPMPAEKPPWPKGARAWSETIFHVTVRPTLAILAFFAFAMVHRAVMRELWHFSGLVLAVLEGR